ncbi:medium chain dehydrogenase/reductase family protein [Kibdelosporangium philippinense]|uniref:Medium chain dehydrogenase/reductase family protein n=1 Tax=Kibdelosporangium philippinense TaxID=211113 RepID=A0ABS8Z5X5_9PSEU|nr:medium chain dehydrogenase/reductase family protein [Kibdelosporangium philippinense]MCE7002458.1 medium chain dehydrogenase/reductase family protein [Kibdelosporangium philippinense]
MITEVELPGVVEPDGLRLRTREVPDLKPGQALVRMEATGVSFAEQQMRRGKYYDQPPFPFVPGYDFVGVIESSGDSGLKVGQRVAALSKTGGWADRIVAEAADLVPVPDGLTAQDVEAVIVNGVTARRMLDFAKVGRGDTVVVLGANGGVGSLLVRLARHLGARVVGVVSQRHMAYVRDLGAIAIDRTGDVAAEIRELAPDGVKAVFDHVGGPGIKRSWAMLGRGGALVSYGTAATRDQAGNAKLPVLALIGRLLAWKALPNGRTATFFNIWAGRKRNPAQLKADLEAVFNQLAAGVITARIAQVFPLSQISAAMTYAESGTAAGKVVVIP